MDIRKFILNNDRQPTERCTVEEFYFNMISDLAQRSSCPLGKRHGALAIKNGRIVSTGYNGPAAGQLHCNPCSLQKDTLGSDWRTCPAVHAEENVIINAARYGTAIDGCSLIVTKKPCARCEALLINAGIVTVYYL